LWTEQPQHIRLLEFSMIFNNAAFIFVCLRFFHQEQNYHVSG